MRGRPDPVTAFAALGDATRMAIVEGLRGGGPRSITALTQNAGMSRQAVTKHLRRLERAGLVRCRRQGRELLWSLDERWDRAVARLRALVE